MKWDKSVKEEITYFSALLVLLFGMGLTIAGFCVSPVGVVHTSILWILGQAFLYCGSVFGLTLYVNSQVDKIKKACIDEIHHNRQREEEQET